MDRLAAAVVGAGPFGLSVAAHLGSRRPARVFGRPMWTWRALMPPDMILRSDWEHTNLAAPGGRGTLTAWAAATGEPRVEPIPLHAFLRYADWFLERFVDEIDSHEVVRVEPDGAGFRVTTGAGDEVGAESLVVAVGVMPFPRTPPAFAGLEDGRIAFALQHDGFARFAGRRVVVVGGAQNALESAYLAKEAGAASVEVVVRSVVRWFTPREPGAQRGRLARRLHRLAYPIVGFGPPPLNRVALDPTLFGRLPLGLRLRLNRRLLRPGASPWIRDRIVGRVSLRERCEVSRVDASGDALLLLLSDGTRLEADACILAAGYRFDLDRLSWLAPRIRSSIALEDGWPRLDRYRRSVSNPRVFMVGYPAELSFGPLSRFVEGTRFAAPLVAEALGLRA